MTDYPNLISQLKASHKVLVELVRDVNAAGGLTEGNGSPTLVCDEDWIDLALTTEKAHTEAQKIEEILAEAGHPISQEERVPEILREN